MPSDLANTVRARMREDLRLRGRALGRRAARIDHRLLRVFLTAYSRPGSRLTLAAVAARVGVTQSAISHILAGDKGRPLPRRLLRACRARAARARYGARQGGGTRR